MSQVTWRASDDPVEQVKAAAARSGRSLNGFVTRVMTAVVDPSTADGESAGLRERLARAAVLEVPVPVASRPDRVVVRLTDAIPTDAATLSEGFVMMPRPM